MSILLALVLAGQSVSSVNQTGGITAARVDGMVVQTDRSPIVDGECLTFRGAYIRNRNGTLDRSEWFKKLPPAERRAIYIRCEIPQPN